VHAGSDLARGLGSRTPRNHVDLVAQRIIRWFA
jgi:hypothetical protein